MRSYTSITFEFIFDFIAYFAGPFYEIFYEMCRNGVARIVFFALYMAIGATIAEATGFYAVTAAVFAAGCFFKCGIDVAIKRAYRIYVYNGGI